MLTFAPMVKYIVYRKVREMPAHAEVDDFISCGLEALIRSIDRYDPDKGATLEQFAWTRIHGAVLDELRRNDWAPRSLRRIDREMGKARDNFFTLYGRRPTREELADALGITRDELVSRQDEICSCHVGSLNILVNGEEDNATERIDTLSSSDMTTDPEQAVLTGEAKEHFRAAFELLAPRERKIAVLLYVYNLTLREIGEILGVTESRVCRSTPTSCGRCGRSWRPTSSCSPRWPPEPDGSGPRRRRWLPRRVAGHAGGRRPANNGGPTMGARVPALPPGLDRGTGTSAAGERPESALPDEPAGSRQVWRRLRASSATQFDPETWIGLPGLEQNGRCAALEATPRRPPGLVRRGR